MRIVSGKYSGRVLNGKIPDGTRPTTDMAREALFNSLAHLIDLEGKKVLDLYSGTGAIGIEALSRGAELVAFVEFGFKQVTLIRENLKLLEINTSYAKVIKKKVLDYLKNFAEEESYDMIFADPPYILNEYSEILEFIKTKKILAENGIVIFESDQFKQIEIPEDFEIIKEKSYGNTKFLFVR